jgi:hypothetical protein
MTVIDGNLIAAAQGKMKVMFSFACEGSISLTATPRKFYGGLNRK